MEEEGVMKQEDTARKHRRVATTKEVHITSDGGQVDQDPVNISKSQDQLTWFAHGSAGATIVFSTSDGSPFEEIIFTVPAKGSVSTGLVKSGAVENKSYKYTVVGRTGAKDPVVIITP